MAITQSLDLVRFLNALAGTITEAKANDGVLNANDLPAMFIDMFGPTAEAVVGGHKIPGEIASANGEERDQFFGELLNAALNLYDSARNAITT